MVLGSAAADFALLNVWVVGFVGERWGKRVHGTLDLPMRPGEAGRFSLRVFCLFVI